MGLELAAAAAITAYSTYSTKRQGQKTKRFADQQEDAASRASALEDSSKKAKKRAAQARLTAKGGVGFSDLINAGGSPGGTLGSAGPQKSLLG